jgi:L-fuconolactonase
MAVRIDAHQHFWRYSPQTHAWIDDTMRPLKRDFLPRDLEPLLRDAGFDSCIAVQAEQSIAETEWLLALADEHVFIRGVVGWVDLRALDVEEQLRRIAARPKLRGVRHIAQDEPDDRFLMRSDFTRGIAALAAFDLAYDILIYPRQMPAAVELAQAFPQQRFVLDHLGKPQIRDGELERWARGIAALSRNRNVSCKLSGMVTEAAWAKWSPTDFTPYLDTVMDWFGPERLMIGSDWPVCTLAGSYGDVTDIVRSYIERLTDSDREAILGGTATRVYGL